MTFNISWKHVLLVDPIKQDLLLLAKNYKQNMIIVIYYYY